MTSLRQIAANQANAQKSTGPKTEEGIARASANSVTHGLTAQSSLRDKTELEKLRQRIGLWIDDSRPSTEYETWLIEVMAVESARYSDCQSLEAELIEQDARRAETSWDFDRRSEVETLAKKLGIDPGFTFAQLRRSTPGVLWLKGRWEGLADALSDPNGWTETDRSLALDLIGAPLQFRRGRTRVDPFSRAEVEKCDRRLAASNGESGSADRERPIDPTSSDALSKLPGLRAEDPNEFRRAFVEAMVAFLECEAARLEVLDTADRSSVLRKVSPEITRELKLLRRYESASFRRFQWARLRFEEFSKSGVPSSSVAEPGGSSADLSKMHDQIRRLREDVQSRLELERQQPAEPPPVEAKPEPPKRPVEKSSPTLPPPPLVALPAGLSAPHSFCPAPSTVSRSPLSSFRDSLFGQGALNRRQRRALAQMSPSA